MPRKIMPPQKKSLVVVWAAAKFRPHVRGRPFYVVTDYRPFVGSLDLEILRVDGVAGT